tara:strand:+ start:871 stop:3015 length:2145 start_codon:yes stop_codon:yes gene_type:complete
MNKFLIKNKINISFLIISFFFLIAVLGLENISFYSTEWLFGSNDASFFQLGWYFFYNDIWRFPPGSNPNYGLELASSIVYTDSIPILAFFFKLIKPIFSGNIQYFSFWYFICFYLQLFFSYKIIKKFTNSEIYSFIASIFFLIAPIFIFRVNWHGSFAGQWLLLSALYLSLFKDIYKFNNSWILLIILSALIEYSSLIMILGIYSLLRIFNLQLNKNDILKIIKDFFIISILLLLTLYLAGYFEVRASDTLGVGFGQYKLNLLSIFDPVNSAAGISWSWFLPDIKLSQAEELEGFNYLGLGQFLMIIFALFLFINKKFKKEIFLINNKKEIKYLLFICLIFTLWALSNKISIGSYTLIEIPLNKFIFAALSIMKNTGRLFYLTNYFFLILSIIIIYKFFKKKNAIFFLSLFLIIQIADTSSGIKSRINFFTPVKPGFSFEDAIWDNLFSKYKTIKTTYPISWPRSFNQFSYYMEKYNIEKTNLVIQARVNRKLAAEARYEMYDNLRNKKLKPDVLYIIDNLGHFRHLKNIYKDENVGFFYRDNIWVMALNEKKIMSQKDRERFDNQDFKILKIDETKLLNFKEEDNFYGFGWSHNFGSSGIWSEGPISTLLIKIDEIKKDIKIKIDCKAYIRAQNNPFEVDIYVNEIFNKKIKITNSNDRKIEFLVKKKSAIDNIIKIDFKFKDLISPYEVLESPDSRKLGLLLKSVKASSNIN